jgi:hypothetical protein
MEANSVLLTLQVMSNTKPNHARIIHFWDIALTVKSVSSLMETMNSIKWHMEICIKLKNVKTFGKKDFVSMGLDASFCTQSAKRGRANRTLTSISKKRSTATWIIRGNPDYSQYCEKLVKFKGKNNINYIFLSIKYIMIKKL